MRSDTIDVTACTTPPETHQQQQQRHIRADRCRPAADAVSNINALTVCIDETTQSPETAAEHLWWQLSSYRTPPRTASGRSLQWSRFKLNHFKVNLVKIPATWPPLINGIYNWIVDEILLHNSGLGNIQQLLSARPAFYLHKRLPDGATHNWGNRHLITAYYSSIDPEGMTGWVGLVCWPIADGLQT